MAASPTASARSPTASGSSNPASASASYSAATTTFVSPALQATEHLPPPSIVSYNGRFCKARIDRNVPLQEIISQLVHSSQLAVSEPAALFCLRDAESDELVTPDNLLRKLDSSARFKLASSPVLEAAETVEKLSSRDDRLVKQAAHALKGFVREPIFVREFISRGGLAALVGVIESASGNTLAYALTSLLTLMDLESGWDGIDARLVGKLCSVVASQSLTNVVRPATAILRRLVLADATRQPESGYEAVWSSMRAQPNCFEIVVGRLGSAASGDTLLVQASLGLVNALMKRAIEEHDDFFLHEIERLDVRAAVVHLVESSRSEDLAPLIVQFQANVIAAAHMSKSTAVTLHHSEHQALLDEAVAQLKPTSETREERYAEVGLHDPEADFARVGLLGLTALIRCSRIASRLLAEQATRPADKRCPLVQASNEALDALCDLFDFTTGVPTLSTVQPLLLAYHRVHSLALRLFVQIWTDAGASASQPADFARVATLVRSQIKSSVRSDGQTSVIDVERDFASADYRTVRDRLTKELAVEDDLLLKAPVRSLRGRLYKESFECVRQQRIRCLQEGAWFVNAGSGQRSSRARAWRFYRLSANGKYLHWVETSARTTIRGGLEDLPERIDLGLVTDIVPHASLSSSTPRTPASRFSQTQAQPAAGPLGFTLLSGDSVLADLQALDANLYSEWIDGLSLLRPDGVIFSTETANLVQSLTELSVKIKLLDLSGERIDIPTYVEPPVDCPQDINFFYATP